VNQVITAAMRRWKKAIFSFKTWSEISTFKKTIKQHKYDAVIDCQGLLKSALITKQALTTIKGLKHGYDKNTIREPIASQFYEKKHAISYQQHAVTRNRMLAALSLGYAPPSNAPNYGIFAPVNVLSLPPKFVMALHGTSRDSKLWPVTHWVDLANALAKKELTLLLPWAGDAEFARANSISQQASNAVVLPKLSISELASVIAKAKAAVGVDTGLSHLAAALNIPIIAIYTDTDPTLTGVMAGELAPAINLGGIGQTPSATEVLDALNANI
jgi:heptosyltransferase I